MARGAGLYGIWAPSMARQVGKGAMAVRQCVRVCVDGYTIYYAATEEIDVEWFADCTTTTMDRCVYRTGSGLVLTQNTGTL